MISLNNNNNNNKFIEIREGLSEMKYWAMFLELQGEL